MNKQSVTYNHKSAVRGMTRADLILISGCLLAAALFGAFFLLHRGAGSEVSISCDGVALYRIDLKETLGDGRTQYYLILYGDAQDADGEQDVRILHSGEYPEAPADGRYNLFSITDGVVTMEAAGCRDQICVRHKPIESDRECIICLPNRLVIEMRGSAASVMQEEKKRGNASEEETLDGIVR